MRLLNTKKIIVESFPNPEKPEIPDYAILSHRWGTHEMSFQKLQHLTPDVENTDGYKKVVLCCEMAASIGFEYIWIDTCCIDKTDKAELTEALNYMFYWYRKAQVCYTYMSDVPSGEDPHAENSKFRQSKWFTRGWTLQELIAPQYVTFFSSDWKEIGTKSGMQELITEITGIPAPILLTNTAGDISVAQRMSWASRRETAVEEDKAYCLMGLFGVNMPMEYGEGADAFRRLQLEIMKRSNDHSILAWTGNRHRTERGLLAYSPREFEDCAEVRRYGDDSAFSLTNKGIHMELPLIPHGKSSSGKEIMMGILSSQRKQGVQYPDRYPLAIYLEKAAGDDFNTYYRVQHDQIKEIKEDITSYKKTKIYLKESAPSWFDFLGSMQPKFKKITEITDKMGFSEKSEPYVEENDPARFDVSNWMQPESEYNFFFTLPRRLHDVIPIEYTEITEVKWTINNDEIQLRFGGSGSSATLMFTDKSRQLFAVSLGVHNYNVWCAITDDCKEGDIKKIARDYWDGDKGNARWDNKDRRTMLLPGGEKVSLAIRKGMKDGKRAYFIEISAGENFWLDKVGPGTGWKGWWNG